MLLERPAPAALKDVGVSSPSKHLNRLAIKHGYQPSTAGRVATFVAGWADQNVGRRRQDSVVGDDKLVFPGGQQANVRSWTPFTNETRTGHELQERYLDGSSAGSDDGRFLPPAEHHPPGWCSNKPVPGSSSLRTTEVGR